MPNVPHRISDSRAEKTPITFESRTDAAGHPMPMQNSSGLDELGAPLSFAGEESAHPTVARMKHENSTSESEEFALMAKVDSNGPLPRTIAIVSAAARTNMT